ncbi:MAG: 50S ribosomal protein L3 [Bacteroidetes bacterium]|nr:50S ribosomal protein L3 [Bacteroidota bacterium]
MLGLIGKKVGMTSIFDDKGRQQNCTVIELGPCTVVQVKKNETDGYNAIQLGFGSKKEKNTTKALAGHFKKAGADVKQILKEFRVDELPEVGAVLNVDLFKEGELVDVVGNSKGRGFQGVVKRHGFNGVGSRTHGQHDRERAPGSVGSSSYPSRVLKGLRMAGQHGDTRVTTKNIQVVKVMPESNLILVRGSVPGATNSFVQVLKTSK